jgi:23S rRNA pseudouridine2457 synthase
MAELLAFHKPYGVLSQFTDPQGRRTLADFIDSPDVYPAGRLDRDSEGLLLLTGDGALQARISHPRYKLAKVYAVQVVGTPDDKVRQRLLEGVVLRDGPAQAVAATPIAMPEYIRPRDPPLPARHAVASSWFSVTLTSGRNRQVRRMLAAVGHPVLRLVRIRIGPWDLDGLAVGQSKRLSVNLPKGISQDSQRSNRS